MSRARLTDAPVLWPVGSRQSPEGPHVAVVPGAQAPLLPVDVPERVRGLARERVAGLQLVEALAVPSDTVELYPFAPRGKKAPFTAMVAVQSDAAQAWRAALQPGCIGLLPDYLALPCIAGVWTVDTGGEGVAVRMGIDDGFAAEPELACRLLAEAEKPLGVLRLGPPDPVIDGHLAAQGLKVVDDPATLAKMGAGKPLRWATASGGVDISAAPSELYERLGATLARWRWPVLVAALALVAYLGTLVLQTSRYQAETERLSALTRDLVRQHFVPEGPILNVRAQVQTAAQTLAVPQVAARDMPALIQFQRAAPLLTREGMALQTAEYRADTGLVTAVTADDFAGLDTLVAELRDAGFLVEVLDSRARASGGVAAQLRLQAERGQ